MFSLEWFRLKTLHARKTIETTDKRHAGQLHRAGRRSGAGRSTQVEYLPHAPLHRWGGDKGERLMRRGVGAGFEQRRAKVSTYGTQKQEHTYSERAEASGPVDSVLKSLIGSCFWRLIGPIAWERI